MIYVAKGNMYSGKSDPFQNQLHNESEMRYIEIELSLECARKRNK